MMMKKKLFSNLRLIARSFFDSSRVSGAPPPLVRCQYNSCNGKLGPIQKKGPLIFFYINKLFDMRSMIGLWFKGTPLQHIFCTKLVSSNLNAISLSNKKKFQNLIN